MIPANALTHPSSTAPLPVSAAVFQEECTSYRRDTDPWHRVICDMTFWTTEHTMDFDWLLLPSKNKQRGKRASDIARIQRLALGLSEQLSKGHYSSASSLVRKLVKIKHPAACEDLAARALLLDHSLSPAERDRLLHALLNRSSGVTKLYSELTLCAAHLGNRVLFGAYRAKLRRCAREATTDMNGLLFSTELLGAAYLQQWEQAWQVVGRALGTLSNKRQQTRFIRTFLKKAAHELVCSVPGRTFLDRLSQLPIASGERLITILGCLAQHHTGQTDAALKAAGQSRIDHPKDSRFMRLNAMLLEQQGDKLAAYELLHTANKLHPKYGGVKCRLAALRCDEDVRGEFISGISSHPEIGDSLLLFSDYLLKQATKSPPERALSTPEINLCWGFIFRYAANGMQKHGLEWTLRVSAKEELQTTLVLKEYLVEQKERSTAYAAEVERVINRFLPTGNENPRSRKNGN